MLWSRNEISQSLFFTYERTRATTSQYVHLGINFLRFYFGEWLLIRVFWPALRIVGYMIYSFSTNDFTSNFV